MVSSRSANNMLCVLLVVSCMPLLIEGRIRKGGEHLFEGTDSRRESVQTDGKHVFFVLLKGGKGGEEGVSAAEMSEEFAKRLGKDEQVKISPASKVD